MGNMEKIRDTDVSALYHDAPKITMLTVEQQTIETNDESDKDSGRWTPMLVLAGATCSLGSALPAGFNLGVMNNPAQLIQAFCNKSFEQRYGTQLSSEALNIVWSTVVSIFLIGGVTGSLTAGWLADKFGRRGALGIGNVCGIIGAALLLSVQISNSVEILLAGRLIAGLSAGFATSLLAMYLTEVAPLKLRGAVGVLCQLGITIGVLLGQVASLNTVLGTEALWPIMLASYSPLCVLALLCTFILPESPKYLYVIKAQEEKALKELSRLRNVDMILLQNEMISLRREATLTASRCTWTIGRVIKDPSLRLPLLLVCSLQLGQQLSGINAVFYYSNSIFMTAGLGTAGSQYATLGTGVINVGMALIAVPLMSVFGRRTLLLKSCYLSTGCIVILFIAITYIDKASFISWLCITAVLAYVLSYGLGLGPIPYFIGAELFDVGPRPVAMSLGSVCNWGGNFLVGMAFPSLQSVIGAYVFLIFAGCTVFLVVFNRIYLPETRGRKTTDITFTMTQGFKSRPNSALR